MKAKPEASKLVVKELGMMLYFYWVVGSLISRLATITKKNYETNKPIINHITAALSSTAAGQIKSWAEELTGSVFTEDLRFTTKTT